MLDIYLGTRQETLLVPEQPDHFKKMHLVKEKSRKGRGKERCQNQESKAQEQPAAWAAGEKTAMKKPG